MERRASGRQRQFNFILNLCKNNLSLIQSNRFIQNATSAIFNSLYIGSLKMAAPTRASKSLPLLSAGWYTIHFIFDWWFFSYVLITLWRHLQFFGAYFGYIWKKFDIELHFSHIIEEPLNLTFRYDPAWRTSLKLVVSNNFLNSNHESIAHIFIFIKICERWENENIMFLLLFVITDLLQTLLE